MKDQSSYLFLNREDAAQQLISKLSNFKNKNCCIVAISNGAVALGKPIAERLNADLVFMPFERISDPADSLKSIGVVSFDYTIVDNLRRDIPQEYIFRKAKALQAELLSRYPYASTPGRFTFQNRIVIVIDDLVETSDKIIGCLKSIRRQQPKEIIVAVPVITRGPAQRIMQETDDVVFIRVASKKRSKSAYLNFSTVNDNEVTWLMDFPINEMIENIQPMLKIKPIKISDSQIMSADRYAGMSNKKIKVVTGIEQPLKT